MMHKIGHHGAHAVWASPAFTGGGFRQFRGNGTVLPQQVGRLRRSA